MGTPVYLRLNITNLLLNPSNPRFDPVKYQSEAIEAMIRDQQDKLVALAKHIYLHGLNPSDIILVKPYKNQWIVCEGNRRVTALKLLNEPSLVPSDLQKLRKSFQELNLKINKNMFENVQCVALDSDEEINEWVRLKHTGENKGAGTVGWDGQQTSRFSSMLKGRPDMVLVFFDNLRHLDTVPQFIKAKLGEIKKTNFDRLLKDPDIRSLLGIEIIDNKLQLVNGINPFLLFVLKDLISEDLTVGRIYHKKDRINYINFLYERINNEKIDYKEISSRIETQENDHDTDVPDSQNAVIPEYGTKDPRSPLLPKSSYGSGKKKASSYHINRKTLIPSHHKLTITHARILKIFYELKSLVVDDYPNAAAVLFRVFIELSADCFILKNRLADGKLNEDSSLSHKIDAISSYFENNKIMTKNELRAIRQMISSETQTHSLRTFNSYVHNKDITPSSTDLKSAWDDICPFIEKIWG